MQLASIRVLCALSIRTRVCSVLSLCLYEVTVIAVTFRVTYIVRVLVTNNTLTYRLHALK